MVVILCSAPSIDLEPSLPRSGVNFVGCGLLNRPAIRSHLEYPLAIILEQVSLYRQLSFPQCYATESVGELVIIYLKSDLHILK
jgi:hypothetical protein